MHSSAKKEFMDYVHYKKCFLYDKKSNVDFIHRF